MHMLERLADLFAPDDCLSCGREGSLLCRGCVVDLPPVPGICFDCNAYVDGVSCLSCIKTTGFNSLTAATHYTGLSKLLVASLKFRGNQSAAKRMADAVLLGAAFPEQALLVHMPATTSHVRERGFDQSKLLVRHLSRASGLPRLDALRRSGSHHQLGAGREQRSRQLAASLHVARPQKIVGRKIILVDDVLTTGSSLTVAAGVLKKAGALEVHGVVFTQAVGVERS